MKLKLSDFNIYFLYIPAVLLIFLAKLNYIIYLVPFISIFTYLCVVNFDLRLLKSRIESFYLYFILFITFLSLCLYFLDLQNFYYQTFFRDYFIIVGLCVFFMFKIDYKPYHIKHILFLFVFIYLYVKDFNIRLVTISSFLEADQHNSNEFIIGFVFGVFVLYFLSIKEYRYLFLSLIVLIISSKRVSYLGLFIALPSYYFFQYLTEDKKRSFLTVYYIGIAVVAFFLNDIAIFFLKILNSYNDANLNKLLSSREVFNEILQNGFYKSDFINQIFGNGLGQADRYLQVNLPNEGFDKSQPASPHNDFMKIIFDTGIVGLVVYFTLFKKIFLVNYQNPISFLYLFPVFMVDNSFAVVYYLMFCGILARVTTTTSLKANEEN